MPTYIHDGTGWKEIVSTSQSQSTGGNIWVRTSSGSGSVNSTRIVGIAVHDGTGWKTAYTAYVPTPPPAPSTPTISRASGWNTRIDTTYISWSNVSATGGYVFRHYDAGYNLIETRVFGTTTYNSGAVSISPGGNTYYFTIQAYNTSDGGTTYSSESGFLRVISGKESQIFSTGKPNNFTSGGAVNWHLSKSPNSPNCAVGLEYLIRVTGNSTDPLVAGFVLVTRVYYTISNVNNFSLASASRAVYFNAPGLSVSYDTANGYGNLGGDSRDFIGLSQPGGGDYKITASGNGWSTTQPGCLASSDPTALITGFGVEYRQTTANQP